MMTHLDDASALTLAEGGANDAARDHAVSCSRCAGLVASFERLLDAAAEVAHGGSPPDRLLRWARAYASTQAQPSPGWTLLGLLSGGTSLVPAVRGGVSSEIALLFGDDRHHLDLRVDPDHDGAARLHGHVVPLAGDPPGQWTVTVVVPEDRIHRTRTDAAGEFWIEGVSGWESASLVASGQGERLVVARLLAVSGAGSS